MLNHELPSEISFSLLTIIVNRGKGSKILQFAREKGASDASCFLGKGTIKNTVLKMIEMTEVNKEMILIVVPSTKENEILNQLNMKFHFERQNHGIAFTMPLLGILKMKRDATIKWNDSSLTKKNESEYTAVFLVVDKGKAESVIEISQDAGYYGGTIIKARGSASNLNIVLNLMVEPEKEAILMLTESKRAKQLATLLSEQFKLGNVNTGILMMAEISKAIGLFQNQG